jgi:hypothetical protein
MGQADFSSTLIENAPSTCVCVVQKLFAASSVPPSSSG